MRASLRTGLIAEQAIIDLLKSPRWKKRSLGKIKDRIGGFDDDELQKLLARAGAVKFVGENGEELWGLISRNRNDL